MARPSWIRIVLLAVVWHAVGQYHLRADQPPNVLFIAVDDLNDWVNCMGGRANVHTPNLDRLAARGTLFTNAHCAAPACNPSRVAMMTGVRPAASGVYNNGQDWRLSPRLADAVTMPEHFRTNGYQAFGGGKIFHALSWIKHGYGKSQNEARAWDTYFPSVEQPMPEAYWPDSVKLKRYPDGYIGWQPIATGRNAQGRPPHFFDWASFAELDSVMADHKVVDWAIEQLQRQHTKPFFHAVGIFRPHIPWFAPKKYFDLYPLDKVALPKVLENDLEDCRPAGVRHVRRAWHKWLVENDEWRPAVQAYLASISFADAQVGRLLDALDNSPYAKNTAIVLWSDHGMHIGEKEQWEKFTLWEESTRVPLIVVAPGVTQAGTTCTQPASLLDVFPTLIELCKLPSKDDLDGQSLLPQLRDVTTARAQPALITWGRNNHALRDTRWRYIRYANGTEEVYDHQQDPDEFHNLAESAPAVAAKVAERMRRWLPQENAERVKNEP